MFLLFLLYHCMKKSFSELYSIKGKVKITNVIKETGKTSEHFEHATIIVIGWGRNFDHKYYNKAFQQWDILKNHKQIPSKSQGRIRNNLERDQKVVELLCIKRGDQPEFKIKDKNYHYALEKEARDILYSEVHSSFSAPELRKILKDRMDIVKKTENIQIKNKHFYSPPKQRKKKTKNRTSEATGSTPKKQKTLQCSTVSSSVDPFPRTTRSRRNPKATKSEPNPVKSKRKNSHTKRKEDIIQPVIENTSPSQSMDKLHNSLDYSANLNQQSMKDFNLKHSFLTTPMRLRNTATNFNLIERDTLPVQNFDGHVTQHKMTGFHLQPSSSMNPPNPVSIFKRNKKEALSGVNFDSSEPANPFTVNFHPHTTWSSELRNCPSTAADFNQNDQDIINGINFDSYAPANPFTVNFPPHKTWSSELRNCPSTVANFNQNDKDTISGINFDNYAPANPFTVDFHPHKTWSSELRNFPSTVANFNQNDKDTISGINFDNYTPANPFTVDFHPHTTWSSELRNFPSTVANFNQNDKDTISGINFDGYELDWSFADTSNGCANNQINPNMGGTQFDDVRISSRNSMNVALCQAGSFECATSSESYVNQTQMDDSPDQCFSPQNDEKTSEAISIQEFESEIIDIVNIPLINFEFWDNYMSGNREDIYESFETQTTNGASEN